MAQHSKARTKAEAQFKQVQKPAPATQPTTKGGQATADYLAAGHAVRAKTAQLRELIPSPIDQNRCAHWRNPMDMIRQG